MKIAVTCDQDQISGHFGYAPFFNIYEWNGERMTLLEKVKNPGHQPGFIPKFLYELGIETMIAGNMGDGAFKMFESLGIDVIVGVKGNIDEALELFAQGKLESNQEVCHEHQHQHDHDHDHHDHQH